MRTAINRLSVLTGATLCALAAPAFAQGQGDFWSALPGMPTPRRLLAAAVVDGKIYTFGGCGSPCFEPPVHTSTFEETLVEVYDPKSGSWSARQPIPAIVFGAAAAPLNGAIYLFGGVVTGNATYAYDFENDAWKRRASMPTWRHGMAAVALGEKVYVLGGSTGAAATNALEAYVPEDDRWERLAPMPTARVFLAAAAAGGKIYAIGGAPDCCGQAVTDAVEVYDPQTNRWSAAAPLPVALQVSAAAGVHEKIYVFGGFTPGAGTRSSTFEYDPGNNSSPWRTLAAMPEPRDQAPAVVLEDGEEREVVHVLGGSVDCHCRALATHSAYTPPSPASPPTADLRIEKEIRAGGVLPGQSVRFTITATNEGPDPVSGALVRDPLPQGLTGATATWTCVASPGSRCSPGPVAGAIADRVDLPVGGQVTYTLTGTLDPATAGTLTNTATVTAPDGVRDPDSGNNTSTVSREIGQCLGIEKTDGRDTVAPGGGALYRITVRNDCPVAMPATVTDDLSDAGLEDVRWCRGPGCTPSTPGDLLDGIELPPGGAVIYRVAGSVPCECGFRTVTNTACVELAGGSVVCASDTNRVMPEPNADLFLDLAGPGSVAAGSTALYTITLTNLGRCAARSIELRSQLPADFKVLAISPPCAQGLALCKPGDIAPGSSVEVTATLEAPAVFAPPASATITAAVESDCDPVPTNDTDFVKIEAGCVPDLAISKSNGVGVLAPGDPVTYEIRVRNLGSCAVAEARVEDVFPPELEQTSWCRGPACAPDQGGPLVDTLDLPAHGEETYVVEALVSPMFAGTLSNTATVSPPEGAVDPIPGNNSATDTDEVQPAPGVTAICKKVSGLFEGGMVTYTFVLWNGGPADQADNPGDEFVDALPPGLTLTGAVADSGFIATVANTVTWNGAIPAGSMVTIEITAMIDLGTLGQTICNQAAVLFDANGDGVNESNRLSSSCCFRVLSIATIPGLSAPGALVLVLALALLALAKLKREARIW